MDVFGTLPVRFHFNGEFIKSGSDLQYCGGNVAMAYIDRDKVSLPELVGHLKDHCVVLDGTLLHWLVPGKELKSGLRAIVDDNTCIEMANSTEECCVADVFVEAPATHDKSESGSEEDSDYEAELGCDTGSEEEGSMEEEAVPEDVDMGAGSAAVKRSITESREKIDKQIQFVKEFYSPSKGKAKVVIVDLRMVTSLALTVSTCLEIAAHQVRMMRPKRFSGILRCSRRRLDQVELHS